MRLHTPESIFSNVPTSHNYLATRPYKAILFVVQLLRECWWNTVESESPGTQFGISVLQERNALHALLGLIPPTWPARILHCSSQTCDLRRSQDMVDITTAFLPAPGNQLSKRTSSSISPALTSGSALTQQTGECQQPTNRSTLPPPATNIMCTSPPASRQHGNSTSMTISSHALHNPARASCRHYEGRQPCRSTPRTTAASIMSISSHAFQPRPHRQPAS